MLFLGAMVKVQGRCSIRKYGIAFSGRQVSRLVVSLVKMGQPLGSELACVEVGPHETQWESLGVGHAVVPWSPAQVAQCSCFMHFSLKCPYSWHLLHLNGSWMSLLTMTQVLDIKMHSLSSLLVVSAEEHVSFKLAVFWFSALSSGFLIQEAEMIEWGGRFWSSSS